MKTKLTTCVFVLIGLMFFTAKADVSLPNILSSNMVLQRNAQVPIWGHAEAGE